MRSSLGDPFLLASYSFTSRQRLTKRSDSSRIEDSLTHVSHCRLPQNGEGQVTVAAQGDGVHVLDLSALHPVSSYTLGPLTTFTCAPATFVSSDEGNSRRRTYAIIDTSPEVKEEDRRRTVWSWEEVLSGDSGASREKQTFVASHLISEIYTPEALCSDIILLSPDGALSWINANFDIRHCWSPPDSTFKPLKSFVFSHQECKFTPINKIPSTGVMVLSFVAGTGELRLRTMALGQDGELVAMELLGLDIKTEDIVDVSLDPSGHLSILSLQGTWYSRRINMSNGALSVSSSVGPLQLDNLSFISRNRSRASRNAPYEVSLLSLGSSHVLLAGVTTSTVPEIALLIWDIQYSVLLDSHILPIPSTLPRSSPPEFALRLIKGSPSQALLVLCPTSPTHSRSSILVVPFNVPTMSTIASAMGRASQGKKWLIKTNRSGTASLDRTREDLLCKMQDAMDMDGPDVVNAIFFEWAERETAKVKEHVRKSGVEYEEGSDAGEAEVNRNEPSKSREKGGKWKSKSDVKFFLGHTFTSRILEIIFQRGKPPGSRYSSKILHYLLAKQAVSNSMVEGGLLSALVAYSDWDSVPAALRHVIDIPESEILQLLHVVVTSHRQRRTTPTTAAFPDQDVTAAKRQISASELPLLPIFFALCISYPVSTATLRMSFRQHFSDPDDLMCLLDILEGWIVQWSIKDITLAFSEVVINEFGVTVTKSGKRSNQRRKLEKLPLLENIITFLQAILDSSMLTLLQHRPAHNVLRKLLLHIEPQMRLNEDLETLRGPLESFTKAQSKAQTDARGPRKREEQDWRKRRKQIHEQAMIAVGLYQVEELVF